MKSRPEEIFLFRKRNNFVCTDLRHLRCNADGIVQSAKHIHQPDFLCVYSAPHASLPDAVNISCIHVSSLRNVRNNMENQPRFARLRELLATHVEEFR